MTATSQRAERLDLPAIYYYAPAIATVRAVDQSLGSVPELNGRTDHRNVRRLHLR